MLMSYRGKAFPILIMLAVFSSCTVTNNLYYNDPTAVGKGEGDFYLGISSGLMPDMDDIDDSGNITYTGDFTWAPNLAIGGQYGFYDRFGARFAMHFASIIGGAGVRIGPQYNFFSPGSRFNAGIGADIGFIQAWDSISIFELNKETNGGWHADVFMPFSFSFNETTRIILTPRYSYNTLYIRENKYHPRDWKYRPRSPSLALGLRSGNFYLEASVLYHKSTFYPNFGIAISINGNQEQDNP